MATSAGPNASCSESDPTGQPSLQFLVLPTADAQNIARRQGRQQAGIADGFRDRDLTRNEARRLERSQARLHREIRDDCIDGGGLTPRERTKFDNQLDRQSRRITRARNN